MKLITKLLLALMLISSLAACGGGDADNGTTDVETPVVEDAGAGADTVDTDTESDAGAAGDDTEGDTDEGDVEMESTEEMEMESTDEADS